MFTLVAYSQDVDTSTAFRLINPISDPHVRVEAPNVIVPSEMNHLLGVYAFGPTVSRCRVETPALRRTLLYECSAVNAAATISYPLLGNFFFANPLALDESEGMRVVVQKTGSASERNTVLVWLGDGAQLPVDGEIHTIEGVWSGALTAFEWGNRSLSFTQTLPAGLYNVVGMTAVFASPVAARLVFVGGTWRPGCVARATTTMLEEQTFRRGNLGVWGEFRHDQPPTVDLLSTGTTSTGSVFLDVIKVG